MESNTTKVALVMFLCSLIAALSSASMDTGYEKPQYKGFTAPKPAIPKVEHEAYMKSSPKMPTKPAALKEENRGYVKSPSKPVIMPELEHGSYEKNSPKIPAKPAISKEEHEGYKKNNPMVPKKEYGEYDKTSAKIPTTEKPKVRGYPKNIAVQGLIYCKYGSKLIPLRGATTRVTCLAVHKNGYESAPFSFSSCPADEKGYFFAKVSSSKLIKDGLWEVTECKAFLENSPWAHCNVPEDTNGGISGARLTFSRMLNGYSLSSVGPFIYNTGKQLSPKEGY